ncbi:Hypothetical predicted protein [Lecanosticta acicola]|uniref:GH64 domain-containing protein n=1 Tax=Lecanosticta acicola TaxID=111012 RepID=A0AAI8YX00_9PEZI|nr:Hypothetical predicted protein [Lecanosticta acicola]
MRTPLTWQGLTVLWLSAHVASIPLVAQKTSNKANIWVTKTNTLNATTWNNETKPLVNFDRTSINRNIILPYPSPGATEDVEMSPSILKSPNGGAGLNRTYPDTTVTTGNGNTDQSSITETRLTVSWTGNLSNVTEVEVALNITSSSEIGAGLASNGTRPASNGTGIPSPPTTPSSNGTTLDNSTVSSNDTLDAPWIGGNTWNTTSSRISVANRVDAGNSDLRLDVVNRLPSNNVKAYISGLSPSGALIMLGQDGQWKYPSTSNSTPVPVEADVAISLPGPNQTLPLTLPGFISSARIWLSDGELQFFVIATPTGPGLVEPAVANSNDPNSETNWGFAEITWTSDGLYADISAVDFVGLPLGITLRETNGNFQQVLGMPSNAAPLLCDRLSAQGRIDGRPWSSTCEYRPDGGLVRGLSPAVYLSQVPNAFGTYFGWYINDAWDYYRSNDLTINTQSAPGNVTCRVVGSQLTCAGDNRGYNKPTVTDIFGCNTGPFAVEAGDNAVHAAVVPRLCAAINRATLLVSGGNVQPSLPPSSYYLSANRPSQSRPMNHYSRIVHDLESNRKGYAFSYDDVSPAISEDQSGFVTSGSPELMTVIVGGR